MPTLVVNGLDDAPWIQQVSTMLATGIPHAHRIDLPDAGHLPSMEYPREVTGLLRTFLRDQRGRRVE